MVNPQHKRKWLNDLMTDWEKDPEVCPSKGN